MTRRLQEVVPVAGRGTTRDAGEDPQGGGTGEGAGGRTPPRGAGVRAAGTQVGDGRVRAKDALGQYGERVALRHLTALGMVVLRRNWRCELGEIDLLLRDGSTLVVCEVKTRSSRTFGTPHEAVTPAKAERLRRLAARWMDESGVRPTDVRFDLVAVEKPPRGACRVEHVPGAY